MIRITVELIPFGIFESQKVVLGVAEIYNETSGTKTSGNYIYKLFGKGGKVKFRDGQINGFPRKRLLAWDLLYRVLKDAVGERNG